MNAHNEQQPAAAQEAVATVESFTNGSYHRNYKLRWHKNVDAGTQLFAAPVTAAPADAEEDAYVIGQMGKLLAEIAVIVNGPEPAGTRWSYHDLPAKVQALASTPAAPATDEQYADADALVAHLDGLMDDGGQGGEKWEPAQAAIAGIRAWQAGTPAAPGIDLYPIRCALQYAAAAARENTHTEMAEGFDALIRKIDASPKTFQPTRTYSLDILGNPMRQYEPGKWESARWPSDASPKGGSCATCNGHGMIGGLLPAGGGYESEPCPDCSPKGGSEALDALRVAYRHMDVESLRVSHCNDLAIIHAAMQAGDAEVQP